MSPLVQAIVKALAGLVPTIIREARRPALERKLADARSNYRHAITAEQRQRYRDEVDAILWELSK